MRAAIVPVGVGFAMLLMQGCAKKDETPVPHAGAPLTAAVAVAPMPDVGKVDTVLTQAEGTGPTVGAATTDAMKSALLQVNGATLDTSSVQVKYGLDISDGTDALAIRGSAFAEAVAQKSGGAITNLKIVNITEPAKSGGLYKVSIEANVAHFSASADSRKIKVVIGPVNFDTSTFVVGTDSVPADKVAEDVRQRVSIALGKSGRFSILDRQLTPEVQSELSLVSSGEAPRAELGKLGQTLTADLIWAGHLDNLAYIRKAQRLQTSDRELVSYSGGWAVSQKLVNVATRQVFASDSLNGHAPDVAPTTLGTQVNDGEVLQNMETDIADAIVASILSRTFPVSIVQRDGMAVVLSQGGDSVKRGERYSVVRLGAQVKDPQTGESLGPTESPCCEVVIDKVTPRLSYGHLLNPKVSLDGVVPGSLQVREALGEASDAQVNTSASMASTEAAPALVKSTAENTTGAKTAMDAPPATVKKPDPKW